MRCLLITAALALAMAAPCALADPAPPEAMVDGEIVLPNVVPPLDDSDDPRAAYRRSDGELPIAVPPFVEHVRKDVPVPVVLKPRYGDLTVDALARDADGTVYVSVSSETAAAVTPEGVLPTQKQIHRGKDNLQARLRLLRALGYFKMPNGLDRQIDLRWGRATSAVIVGKQLWVGTEEGLYINRKRVQNYGVFSPLASFITALAADSKGNLWVGTPLGLSVCSADGTWRHIQGRDGLPCEHVTALSFDDNDRLWIGTTRGAVHYRPYEEGRQWFYRAGQRYLPDDYVIDIAVTADGSAAFVATKEGLACIQEKTSTLLEKAEIIERRVNERHRRLGLVGDCVFDNANDTSAFTIPDYDNDGLWTAYHVAAMSLCFGATGDAEARRSAAESMNALYMLQNASGIPGLVARSVVPAEVGKTKDAQWRPTPDGSMYWKSDTSSDEIDGHYLAFYTYWEHIAKDDPAERDLLIKQIREVTDYIVGNNYQLIDWDGERTRWGFWNPEALNDNPTNYLENGLNSLQILSFLKVAHYVTGDETYKEHFDRLITEHGYLGNVLLSKKVFPDENNHSDNQLGYVAWYPILQLERDPRVREALQRAVRRHYKIVEPEKPSFFTFVTATIDPHYVDLNAAVENLVEIPTDRRQWLQDNSRRADVVFDPRVDRFGKQQLLKVLPADERCFGKWNRNPYLASEGGDGREEDDGAAYLLPYWMGRYHGFIAETQ